MSTKRQAIGLGVNDFKEMMEKNYYFVDKSLFIKDIIEDGTEVKLITRPRRFGKTINMSMLKYFFDVENREENRKLFSGLDIETANNGEYMKYQGAYPVVYLSLKNINSSNLTSMESSISSTLNLLYKKHINIYNSLASYDKKVYDAILNMEHIDNSSALKFLTQVLNDYYCKKVILLVDEYDAPLLNAYSAGFYDEMIEFFKVFYGSALKDNEYLEMAVLTGITRVAKESIFSGLNNPGIYTILKNDYKEYFGFNEDEVKEILEYYDLGDNMAGVQDYYDGYHFGNHIKTESKKETVQVIDMYNPWSIINFAKEKILKSFWINTSGDSLIKDIAKKDFGVFLDSFLKLLNDESLEIEVDEFITLQNIGKIRDIWTLLLHSGYLTVDKHKRGNRYMVKLPNEEVKTYFSLLIDEIMSKDERKVIDLLEILYSDFNGFSDIMNNRALSCASYHDLSEEQHYHNLLLGALIVNAYNEYEVRSNRESGLGRPDIIVTKRGLKPEDDETYIFEVKHAKEEKEKESKLKDASEQILKKKYADTIKGKIHIVAVVACDKSYTFEMF